MKGISRCTLMVTSVTFLFLLMIALLFLAFLASQKGSAATVQIVVNNTSDQVNPAISGQTVIWQDYRDTGLGCPSANNCPAADIYIRNINGFEQKLTTIPNGLDPRISDNLAVWCDSSTNKVVVYNLATGIKQNAGSSEGSGYQSNPAVSGNKIVWVDSRNSPNYGDIYMRDMVLATDKSISTASNDPSIPDVKKDKRSPDIDGNIVVWQDWRNAYQDELGWWRNPDIYVKNIFTGIEQPVTTELSDQNMPKVSGNKVVWQDHRNGNWDIFLKDLANGEETNLTSGNADDQTSPDISGDTVIWKTRSRSTGVEDIHMKQIATGVETAVSNDLTSQKMPVISGSNIAWADKRDGNWDIYYQALSNQSPEAQTKTTIIPTDTTWSGAVNTWVSPYWCNSCLPEASWIWGSYLASPETYAEFNKQFNINGTVQTGSIDVLADDWSDIYVNGNYVGRGGNWWEPPTSVDIGQYLVSGQNTVSLRGFNHADPYNNDGYHNPAGIKALVSVSYNTFTPKVINTEITKIDNLKWRIGFHLTGFAPNSAIVVSANGTRTNGTGPTNPFSWSGMNLGTTNGDGDLDAAFVHYDYGNYLYSFGDSLGNSASSTITYGSEDTLTNLRTDGPILDNWDFSSDLSKWVVLNPGDDNATTGTIEWSNEHSGSAKIDVSGSPSVVSLLQNTTRPIFKGEQIGIRIAHTDTQDFANWSFQVAGAEKLNNRPGSPGTTQSNGEDCLVWTADDDYPSGTEIMVRLVSLHDSATFWLERIEAGDNTPDSCPQLFFSSNPIDVYPLDVSPLVKKNDGTFAKFVHFRVRFNHPLEEDSTEPGFGNINIRFEAPRGFIFDGVTSNVGGRLNGQTQPRNLSDPQFDLGQWLLMKGTEVAGEKVFNVVKPIEKAVAGLALGEISNTFIGDQVAIINTREQNTFDQSVLNLQLNSGAELDDYLDFIVMIRTTVPPFETDYGPFPPFPADLHIHVEGQSPQGSGEIIGADMRESIGGDSFVMAEEDSIQNSQGVSIKMEGAPAINPETLQQYEYTKSTVEFDQNGIIHSGPLFDDEYTQWTGIKIDINGTNSVGQGNETKLSSISNFDNPITEVEINRRNTDRFFTLIGALPQFRLFIPFAWLGDIATAIYEDQAWANLRQGQTIEDGIQWNLKDFTTIPNSDRSEIVFLTKHKGEGTGKITGPISLTVESTSQTFAPSLPFYNGTPDVPVGNGCYYNLPCANWPITGEILSPASEPDTQSSSSNEITDWNAFVYQNQQVIKQISIPNNISNATFTVNNIGSKVTTMLISPSGQVISDVSLPSNVWQTEGTNSKFFAIRNPEPGDWTIQMTGTDIPEGGEPVELKVSAFDEEPPLTIINESKTPAVNNWLDEDQIITLSATDNGSGVVSTEYSLDNGSTWNTYSEPFLITQPGSTTVLARSTDGAGNTENPVSRTINICGKPQLSPDFDIPYWSSYADYQNRVLSVEFRVNNWGNIPATNAQILNADSTNGVILSNIEALPVGNLDIGSSITLALKFSIPPGVGSFITSVSATSQDPCGISHTYP